MLARRFTRLVFYLLVLVAAAGPGRGEDDLVWIERYEAALEEARRTGKPIFLEFRCAP
jgi:hypothetical protein